MFPTFTPLGAIDSTDEIKQGPASEREKSNYDVTYRSDYELEKELVEPVEEDYEVTDDQKNPERNFGKPGIRLFHNEEHEIIKLDDDEMPSEDDTPVAVDDAKKHGSKNKYRFGGDEGQRGPNYESEIS